MEIEISTKTIEEFLEEYPALNIELEQTRISENIPKFDKLLDEFTQMKSEYHLWNKDVAERYNIFKVLNIRHAETKTHTPYLINLLNPKGSHAQGLLFFNLFIDKIAPQSKRYLFQNLKIHNLILREEKHTVDGRLDIFIESFGREEKFVIVIENKINAKDQDLQLSRYYRYCKGRGFTDDNILLIYLTKEGENAKGYSMVIDDQERLKKADVLIDISYHNEMSKIMKMYIDKLESSKVRFIAQQYLDIIKTI